jgi:hypothetical protein
LIDRQFSYEAGQRPNIFEFVSPCSTSLSARQFKVESIDCAKEGWSLAFSRNRKRITAQLGKLKEDYCTAFRNPFFFFFVILKEKKVFSFLFRKIGILYAGKDCTTCLDKVFFK